MTSLGTKLYSLLSLIKIHEYRGLCTTLPDYSLKQMSILTNFRLSFKKNFRSKENTEFERRQMPSFSGNQMPLLVFQGVQLNDSHLSQDYRSKKKLGKERDTNTSHFVETESSRVPIWAPLSAPLIHRDKKRSRSHYFASASCMMRFSSAKKKIFGFCQSLSSKSHNFS